jgi:hypothetical protein
LSGGNINPQGATLNAYGGTPGTNSSAVREWIAVDSGIVHVSARAFSLVNQEPGAFVNVLIQHNGKRLWESSVTNGQGESQAVTFGQWVSVSQGDNITFEIVPSSSSSWTNNTYFRAAVWLQRGQIVSSNLVVNLSANSNGITLQWPGSVGQTYLVEAAPAVAGPWSAVSFPRLCTSSVTNQQWSAPVTNSPTYYRLFLVQ